MLEVDGSAATQRGEQERCVVGADGGGIQRQVFGVREQHADDGVLGVVTPEPDVSNDIWTLLIFFAAWFVLQRWVLPYIEDSALWPVLIVLVAHAMAFIARINISHCRPRGEVFDVHILILGLLFVFLLA